MLKTGDILKTNPKEGYWGCAIVLKTRGKTKEFNPMCLVAITPFVFKHDYDINELDLSNLQVLYYDQRFCLSGKEPFTRPRIGIEITTRKINQYVDIIGNIDDVSNIYSNRLVFKVGDASSAKSGWPLSGPIDKFLGIQAVQAWRKVYEKEQWLKDMYPEEE